MKSSGELSGRCPSCPAPCVYLKTRNPEARAMTNSDIVRDYFKRFFSGKARHSDVRSLLADDFTSRDPLMSADSADAYVDRLKAFGDTLATHADVRHVLADGDTVAALVDFHGPSGKMPYAQWFTFRSGKIARLEVIYDPRPFLQGQARK